MDNLISHTKNILIEGNKPYYLGQGIFVCLRLHHGYINQSQLSIVPLNGYTDSQNEFYKNMFYESKNILSVMSESSVYAIYYNPVTCQIKLPNIRPDMRLYIRIIDITQKLD